MKIVVANSVGVDQDGYHMVHVPSRWSLGVKNFTNCSYYPWQLAYTSALLKRETKHEVKLLDGVLHGWNFAVYFELFQIEEGNAELPGERFGDLRGAGKVFFNDDLAEFFSRVLFLERQGLGQLFLV